MSVRSAVLRSLLVVVTEGFSAAARVTGAAASSDIDGTDDETGNKSTMTPPAPLGPRASAGRQAVMTGVGPGPSNDGDD